MNAEYFKKLKNIHRSALIFNNKHYPLFLFEDILQIPVTTRQLNQTVKTMANLIH